MKSKSNPFLLALSCTTLAASAITALFCGNAAFATTYTWTKNTVATQDWTTAGNWDVNGQFATGNTNTLTFFADTTTALANGTNNITTNVPTALTMNVLTLNGKSPTTSGQTATINIASSSSTWTLDGTTPTVNLNGLSSTGNLAYTVAAKIALAQATTAFTGNGTASFNFSGVISGTGKSITKTGTSALTLSGANTYTGGTTVSAGTLNINNNSALGTGLLTINNGNTTFDNTSGGLISIANNITSTNNTIFSGTNALTTSGTYNYNHTARTLTVNGSGTLTVGSLQVDSSTGLLRKAGTGTLAITGASSGGATGIEFGANAGVVIMGNMASLGGQSLAVINGGSGTLQSSTDLTGTNKITNGVTLTGTGALTLSGTNNFEIGGAITSTTNTSTLTKSGSNAVTLSGTNTYTGGTTISAGVLSYVNLAAKPSTGTTAVGASGSLALGVATVPGTTYFSSADIDNLFAGTMTGNLSNVTVTATSGVGIDTSAGDFTYATSVSGSPTKGLVKLGANTLTLSGTNTYTGNTTVIAGVLSPTLASTLPGYNSSGKVVFNGGIVSAKIGDGTATGWSTAQVDSLLTNATKTSGAIGIDTTNGNLTQWTAFTTTNLGSTLGLAKLGANTLTLDQANTYTGPTTVSNGTLAVTATSGLGASTVTTNSATMVLSGGNGTLGALANTTGLSMINNGTLQLQANVANTSGGVSTALTGVGTTNQVLTGGGGTSSTIQLRGDSNVTFFAGSNGNGFMGGVNNASGFTLNFDVNQLTGAGGNNAFTFGSTTNGLQIGRNVQVNVTGGNSDSLVLGPIKYVTTVGTLTLNPTTANLSVAGFTNNQGSAATLKLDGTSINNFINGVIANSTGSGTPATVVTKTNSSTWTLNAANTYSGGTTVSNGTLALSGSGTLGSISGALAVSGGTLDLGNTNQTVGATTLGGSSTIQSGGTQTLTTSGVTVSSTGNTIASSANVTGNTTLNSSAALTANSAITGTMTVSSGATLSGSGSVSGTTGVTSGTINGSGLTLTGVTTFNGSGNTLSGTVNSTGGVTLASGAAVTQTGTLTGNLNTTDTGIFTANGTVTGTATVATGGTLAGSGTIGGAATINGTLAPNAGSTLTIGGTLTTNSSSIFNWTISDTSASAGTNQGSYSHLNVTGGVSGTAGAAVFNIVIPSGQNLSDPFWNTNSNWTNIFNSNAVAAQFGTIEVNGGSSYTSQATDSGVGYFTFNGSSNSLTWTAVPEPTSALVGLLIGAGMLRRRRTACF